MTGPIDEQTAWSIARQTAANARWGERNRPSFAAAPSSRPKASPTSRSRLARELAGSASTSRASSVSKRRVGNSIGSSDGVRLLESILSRVAA